MSTSTPVNQNLINSITEHFKEESDKYEKALENVINKIVNCLGENDYDMTTNVVTSLTEIINDIEKTLGIAKCMGCYKPVKWDYTKPFADLMCDECKDKTLTK